MPAEAGEHEVTVRRRSDSVNDPNPPVPVGTKLSLTRWFLAMQLLTQSKNNVSALELMRQLGVSYRSAWLVKHKIMEAMRLREDHRELDGRVEMDDAYLGGERSGGKSGRGSENKVPFIAAVQTSAEGQPQYACLAKQPFTAEAVAIWAAKSLATSAQVISDGLWCFRAVTMIGAEHEPTVTTKRDPSAGQVYLVSDGAPVTRKEFFGYYAKMAEKPGIRSVPRWLAKLIALGMEITSKFTGRPPKITREAIRFLTHQAHFDIEKARHELGYQPRFSLQEGMKLTEQWLKEAGYLPKV